MKGKKECKEAHWHKNGQMTKIQFSDEFDTTYSRKNYPWTRGTQ